MSATVCAALALSQVARAASPHGPIQSVRPPTTRFQLGADGFFAGFNAIEEAVERIGGMPRSFARVQLPRSEAGAVATLPLLARLPGAALVDHDHRHCP